MASADDPSRHRSSVADEKGNPFVTFSRLVDQQMSSLFRNMFDLSSSLGSSRSTPERPYHSPPSADEQRRWREEADVFEKSLNGFFEQHRQKKQVEERPRPNDVKSMRDFLSQQSLQEHPQDDPGKERDEARRILDCVRDAFSQMTSHDENEETPPRCPYTPQPSCPYRPESEEAPEYPRTAHAWSILPFGRRAPVPTLVDFIYEDPYSPLQIEDRHPFCEHGSKWRRAFADLLAVQHGIDAPCEHQHEEMSKENWLLALPVYLESQQDPPNGNAIKQPENDAGEDGATELDLYNHFLGARSPRVSGGTFPQPSSINAEGHDASGQLNIISTMTTTQRTTRPDGSIYTRVVLKKRFSDGREESTETEHTTHDTNGSTESTKQSPRSHSEYAARPTLALGYDGKVKQAIGRRLEEKKKKTGWFWS